MGRPSKQNINKDIMALNNALNEVDLTYIERDFHPRKAKYTLFSNAHGTFSKIDHMIGHQKPQQVQENWNHIKHFLLPQGTETRNQPQRKKLKNTHTHGDWIAFYETMTGSRRRSRKKSKSFWKQMKMNWQQSRIYGTQWRQSWEGSSWQYRPTLKR